MTEDQIERFVERETNKYDALLMNGTWTQAEYDEQMRLLSARADLEYSRMDHTPLRSGE